MPKASVIVPVYNVKDYLKKCVDSILAQTEADFELLLIDDGSTDESGALCDTLAQSDERIRVIHQENRGLGGARNSGSKAAVGDWLLYVDSDDWIEPETLERAIIAGERANAEMVVFGMRTVDENGNIGQVIVEDLPKNTALSVEERKEILLIAPSAANKLFRREWLLSTGIEFPSRVWYEDIRTTPKLMIHSKAMVFIDFVGYNYFQRSGSIMNSNNIDRNVEIIDAFDDLLGYFKEQGKFDEYKNELRFLTLSHVYLVASIRVIRLDRKHSLIKKFAEYIRREFPDYRQSQYMYRLTRNQRIALKLLEMKQYLLIDLIFKIKDR